MRQDKILDFETASFHDITVTASSGTGPKTVAQNVRIVVNDIYEPPTLVVNQLVDRIDEGPVGDTPIDIATVTFENAEGYTLSVSPDGQSYFEFNGSTLVLKANTIVDTDFENTAGEISFAIWADKSGEDRLSKTIIVDITDINDELPDITTGDTGTDLLENVEVSPATQIYRGLAIPDHGVISWSLVDEGDFALFNIDSGSGVVTFKNATTPDHETKSSYTFTIRATATDGPHIVSNDKVVTINVTDANDMPPVFNTPSVTSSDTVFIYQVPADEAMSSFNHFMSSVDLASGRHGAEGTGAITITLLRANGSVEITGEIDGLSSVGAHTSTRIFAVRNGNSWTLQGFHSPLDQPTGDENILLYNLLFNGPSDEQLLLATRVENGRTFLLEPEAPVVTIEEDASVDDVIYAVPEAIADTSGATVSYEMLAQDDHDHFTFDAATREIKVKDSLDFEGGQTSYTVTIRATATEGSTTQHADKVVTINVTDVNDTPVFDHASYQANVDVNIGNSDAAEDEIITVTATDGDGGDLTYAIIRGDEAGLFEIGTQTGIISLASGQTLGAELKLNT